MPRDIPVGNSNTLICFDADYQIRDLYYPNVGQENHIMGYLFRFGIWVDGVFTWINNHDWHKELKYKKKSLVTDVKLTNHKLGLEITCHDFVDIYKDQYVRQLHVKNLKDHKRDVRIFFHHDFRIYGSEVGDTGVYHPLLKAVVHYKKERYFVCGLSDGVEHYSIGAKALGKAEGTWKDAEDGELQNTIITHGSVDSTIGKYLSVEPHGTSSFDYWICMGKNLESASKLHLDLSKQSRELLQHKIDKYWQLWCNKEKLNLSILPERYRKLFYRSLLTVRTQINHNGAILAANDSDVQFTYKDHYSYLWPRDGAMVANALDLAGYEEITQKFYKLISKIIDKQGFLLHKYDPTGSLASSWHPWIRGGHAQLPIQEDETALILWSLWTHFQQYRNVEYIIDLYYLVILPAGQFLMQYRDEETGLPLPSFDLWEERRGILTFTCCTVEAGLRCAGNFAELFGDEEKAQKFHQAAKEVKTAIEKNLYSKEHSRYIRGFIHPNDHEFSLEADYTIDASLYSLFRFGTFEVDDPKVQSTMQAYRDKLNIKTHTGGYARYQGDWYHINGTPSENIPGNPWIISTLWLMQEEIMKAKSIEELEKSLEYLEWLQRHSLPSGILSEQIDPHTGKPISVSPLTWSHSTVIEVIVMYINKYEELVK